MELEEICGIVWKALAVSDISLTANGIAETESLSANDVRRALASLNQAGLLWRNQNETPPSYKIKHDLNALEWAQAVEVGVELRDLEGFVRLKSGQDVGDVLKIAASGGVEKNRKKQADQKLADKRKWLEGRSASRAAETDLARLVEDVRAAHIQSLEKVSLENDEVRKALLSAQQEAERALLALQKSLH